MKEFFDTSILIAAFWGGHPRHEPSVKLLGAANRKRTACGVHSLAEVYAGMTALPVRPAISPEQAVLFVDDVRMRLSLVTLTGNEYLETIRKTAAQGFSSGRIYDALLLQCARKVRAEIVYTWNLKHFRAIAPDLAGRIHSPAN